MRAAEIGDRTGNHQQAPVVAVPAQLFEEHNLVGENVARIAMVVIEIAQHRIQKARWTRGRDHPGRCDVGDVLAAAIHSALALLNGEGLLGAIGHVVDHRIPDSPGVLRHVHVDTAEFGQCVQAQRPGIIHVEHRCVAVGDHDPGVADWAVGRSAQRDDHHVKVALGAAEAMLDGVLGLEELVKAQRLQLPLEVWHRKVRQQHHGVGVHVLSEQGWVEVVGVQVRDVQVIAIAYGRPVQRTIVREHEPGAEVGGVEPRIAQHAARPGIDSETGVADTGDLHVLPPSWWMRPPGS